MSQIMRILHTDVSVEETILRKKAKVIASLEREHRKTLSQIFCLAKIFQKCYTVYSLKVRSVSGFLLKVSKNLHHKRT